MLFRFSRLFYASVKLHLPYHSSEVVWPHMMSSHPHRGASQISSRFYPCCHSSKGFGFHHPHRLPSVWQIGVLWKIALTPDSSFQLRLYFFCYSFVFHKFIHFSPSSGQYLGPDVGLTAPYSQANNFLSIAAPFFFSSHMWVLGLGDAFIIQCISQMIDVCQLILLFLPMGKVLALFHILALFLTCLMGNYVTQDFYIPRSVLDVKIIAL